MNPIICAGICVRRGCLISDEHTSASDTATGSSVFSDILPDGSPDTLCSSPPQIPRREHGPLVPDDMAAIMEND